jgi:purine catabolism regulator
VARTWAGVRDGLIEASASVPAAARKRDRDWYDATRPSLDRLLWSLRDQADLIRFVNARLGPLLAHDAERSVRLLPTLRAYCEHGGRRAETARALHLERQSLYHRIARIEQLLEVDLRDADELLGLHLALRARELIEGSGAKP